VPHILVIDDSAAIHALLRTMLEDRGHQVTEAADGAKGLKAFRQEPADVVLCELFMPHTDGLAVEQEDKGSEEAPPRGKKRARKGKEK
jgi:CheY-like chemotaxis protein